MDKQAIKNFHRRYLSIICFIMAICTMFFTKIVFAEQYQLKLVVDLSQFKDVSTDAIWLEPVTSSTNGSEFFVAQNNGSIFLAGKDGNITQEAILNLPLIVDNPAFISLTAMTLHPSFTRPELSGYATLFTAHTTEFGPQINNNRLAINDVIVFAFETVITAWQYDFEKQKIDPKTQREVLRIPIKTMDNAIKNLTFDPYQKSWNGNYGQLYFSLNYINELKEHPLYSGVILRILPEIFGVRNYTISQSNPFVKNPEINDEIVVMGGQNIEHFFWAKNDHASIFIQHNNIEQHRLSKATLGDNLLSQPQSNFLWQQPTAMSSMLLYQGRNFLSLRNKMVFFTLLDNQWHLTSLSLAPINNELPKLEELNTIETLSAVSHLNIHQDSNGEIILFDNRMSRLYSLHSSNSAVVEASAPESNTTEVRSNRYFLHISLFAILLLIFIFIFLYRKNTRQQRPLLIIENDHLRLRYEPTTQTILLFKTNHKNAHKTLTIDDIISCEVLLNNNVINIVDNRPENVLSNQIETDIRGLFTKEHFIKMDDDKTRHIGMVLSDKDDIYPVCMYLRKGSNRMTDTKYFEIIDILIDLCWAISKHTNPQDIETRVISMTNYSPVPARQTSTIIPKRHYNINKSVKKTAKSKITEPNPVGQDKQQTDLVDSLDKLVNLHQKGYLSDEEFSLAKAKLLQ